MKKIIVLGLCLVTTVSVFCIKDKKSNSSTLGDAKIVALNERNDNIKLISAIPTALTHVNWAKTRLRLEARQAQQSLDYPLVGGTVEKSLSNVELQDEIGCKLKVL